MVFPKAKLLIACNFQSYKTKGSKRNNKLEYSMQFLL